MFRHIRESLFHLCLRDMPSGFLFVVSVSLRLNLRDWPPSFCRPYPSIFSEGFFSFIFSTLLLNFSFLLSYFWLPRAFSSSPSALFYIARWSCFMGCGICSHLSDDTIWSFLSAAFIVWLLLLLFLFVLVSVSYLRGFPGIIWWSLVCWNSRVKALKHCMYCCPVGFSGRW